MNQATTSFAPPTQVSFTSGDQQCRADFYRPGTSGPFPLVILAHGLGGVRTMRLGAFAERFLAEGYACLVFDYRHFGDSEGQPRQLLDINKQLEDWQSALNHARTLTEIDPTKIVLWGTSFGGGHVLAAAAKDQGVAAVISQGPFTNGLASTLAVDPVVSMKVTAKAIQDRVGALFGAEPVMVTVAALPGETGLMSSQDAYTGFMNLQSDGQQALNYVAARFALDIIRYYPGRKAKDIKVPVLFCVCENDTVAPAGPTLKYAAQAPKGEIKCYADGHFDIYIGDAFERVVADQILFLRKHVPA